MYDYAAKCDVLFELRIQVSRRFVKILLDLMMGVYMENYIVWYVPLRCNVILRECEQLKTC